MSVVTLSVVEPLLDVEPVVVPAAVELLSDMNAHQPFLVSEVGRLIVASSSPGPLDVCVATVDTVTDDGVAAFVGPVDVAVQTEGGMCVLKELIDHVKQCVLMKISDW